MAADKSSSMTSKVDPLLLEELYPNPRDAISVRPAPLSRLKKDCLYLLDTNVLLAPYRFGEQQTQELSDIYRRLKAEGRLFLPSRAAQEFANRRRTVLSELQDKVMAWKTNAGKLQSPSVHKCPMLEGHPAHQELLGSVDKLWEAKASYEAALKRVQDELIEWSWDDPISELYSDMFDDENIVHHGLERDAVLEGLDRRISNKIPPGYKDSSKDDNGVGDFLIWHSILNVGRANQKNVVFVSNEEKADWVVAGHSKILGVRPELFYEFYNETRCLFGIVGFSRFLELEQASEATVRRASEVESDAVLQSAILEELDEILNSLSVIVRSILNACTNRSLTVEQLEGTYLDELAEDLVRNVGRYGDRFNDKNGWNLLGTLANDVIRIVDMCIVLMRYVDGKDSDNDIQKSYQELEKSCNWFLRRHYLWMKRRVN